MVGSTFFCELSVNFHVNFMHLFLKEGGFQQRIHVMYVLVRREGAEGSVLENI